MIENLNEHYQVVMSCIPRAATVAIGWIGRDPRRVAVPAVASSAPPPITPKGVTRI